METRTDSYMSKNESPLIIQDLNKCNRAYRNEGSPSYYSSYSPKLKRVTFMNSPESKSDYKDRRTKTRAGTTSTFDGISDFSVSAFEGSFELPNINEKINRSNMFDRKVMSFYIQNCFDKNSIEDKLKKSTTTIPHAKSMMEWKPFVPPKLESISNKYALLKHRRGASSVNCSELLIKEGILDRESTPTSDILADRVRALDQTMSDLFNPSGSKKMWSRPRRKEEKLVNQSFEESPQCLIINSSILRRKNINVSESTTAKRTFKYVKICDGAHPKTKLTEFEYKQIQDRILGRKRH